MDSQSIQQFLGFLNAKRIQARGKWVQCSCPLAPWYHDTGHDSSPSFAVRVEPHKKSWFNCFVCKYGDLGDLIVELQSLKANNIGMNLNDAWSLVVKEDEQKLSVEIADWGQKKEEETDKVIPDWWLDSFRTAWQVPYAREYLEFRMVSLEIATKLDIRWDRSLKTVCFPVRNRQGELVSMRGRFISPSESQPPYHVYPFMGQTGGQAWLGEHTVDFSKPVLMVESVFDMTSALRVYDNVISPMTVGINSARMKRVSAASEVVTLFDRGTGGDKARAIVQKHLGSALVIHRMPIGKDPGEMSVDQLNEVLGGVLNLKKSLILS